MTLFKPWVPPYSCLMADPPWTFKDTSTRLAPDYEGPQRMSERRYHVMTLGDICAMGEWIRFLTTTDAFLFLWAPGALILDGQAQRVARAWGFEPKQVWDWVKLDKSGKPRIGGGHYARLVTEYMLLCRKGKATVKVRNENNLIMEQRREHSEKPDEAYRKIERLVDGPYLELFARRQWSPLWDVWGNEIEGLSTR